MTWSLKDLMTTVINPKSQRDQEGRGIFQPSVRPGEAPGAEGIVTEPRDRQTPSSSSNQLPPAQSASLCEMMVPTTWSPTDDKADVLQVYQTSDKLNRYLSNYCSVGRPVQTGNELNEAYTRLQPKVLWATTKDNIDPGCCTWYAENQWNNTRPKFNGFLAYRE